MSIQSWILIRPDTDTASVMCRVGRIQSGWYNTENGTSITSTDTALTKTTSVTVTFSCPTAPVTNERTQTSTISDLDNDAVASVNTLGADTSTLVTETVADSVRRFTITGCTAGTSYPFTLSVDTGAGVQTTASGSLKTIPKNYVRMGKASCMGAFWDTTTFPTYGVPKTEVGDAVVGLDCHYFAFIDDALYQAFGSSDIFDADYCPPKATGAETAPTWSNSADSNHRDLAYDRTGSDTSIKVPHTLATLLCNPLVKRIGQHCPMVFVAGDHDFMPGNDWDHETGGFSTLTDSVTGWRKSKRCWDVYCGSHVNPTTFAAAPTTAEYPSALGGTPGASYGAEAQDYYPTYFRISNDVMVDYFPDYLTHRDPTTAATPATIMGSTQLSEFNAAVATHDAGAASPKPFLVVSSAKQLFTGVISNTDSYVLVGDTDFKTERDSIVNTLAARDKAVMVFTGDSHYQQHSLLDGGGSNADVFEMNVAPINRTTTNTLGQTDTDTLFAGTSARATEYSGDFVSSEQQAFAITDTAKTRRSWGFSEITAEKATHMTLDVDGNVVGGVVVIYPYTKSINQLQSQQITGQAGQMAEILLEDIAAGQDGTPESYGFGFEITSGPTLDDLLPTGFSAPAFAGISLGELLGGNYPYGKVIGIYDKTGKSAGLKVFFDASVTDVDDTKSSLDDWPEGLEITISLAGGSQPLTMNSSNMVAAFAITGYKRFDYQVDGTNHFFDNGTNQPDTGEASPTKGIVTDTLYDIKFVYPSAAGGGAGIISSMIDSMVN